MRAMRLIAGSALAIFLFSAAFAQTKTVTNADLERYRAERLAAEKDLRENYEELGFPSPEELEARERESRREYSALARRLQELEAVERNEGPASGYYGTSPAPTVYPYPNPSFVDYGGRYAPSYRYYRLYYPRYRYPVRRGQTEPRRFETFRRQWRDAVQRSRRHD